MNIKVFLLVITFLFNIELFARDKMGGLISGSESAPLLIEEFVDFQCPYCVRGSNTMQEIVKNYPGKVKLSLRNMPLPFHEHALIAAKAFSAVYLLSPDLAFEFQSQLFNHQEQLAKYGEVYLFKLADKIGVNVEDMKNKMKSEEVEKIIADDKAAAAENNFQGAPSFKIGNKKVTGAYPYEEIKQIVESELNK